MKCIRIGTRGSMLAMAQAKIIADAIDRIHSLQTELVPIVTSGDRRRGPLAPIGGKGLFTAELEESLRNGSIDVAVHSAKDLPAEMPDDMVIGAVPEREDPRDAIFSPGGDLDSLQQGAKVATSSLRRRAQLLDARSDLEVIAIRGNVETRLKKVLGSAGGEESIDAVIVAMAGVKRSGLLEEHKGHIYALDIERFIPAAGQGALVVQALADNEEVLALVAALDEPASRSALEAERVVVRALGADCHSCLAVYIYEEGSCRHGRAMAARSDGSGLIKLHAKGTDADETAAALLKVLNENGAGELISH